MIVPFSGSIISIPSGWTLCDGTNGTPNLQDKFIVGAGDTYNPGIIGGAINHDHDFTSDSHQHGISASISIESGANYGIPTISSQETGTTNNGSSLPPYFALAYIMKT